MSKTSEYVIIIDTDQYSGNFEREMCAYLTGQYGECGVGDDISESERDNIKNIDWWDENIIERYDEHGCSRPVEIYPTPGLTNNGMGQNSVVTESNPYKYPAYQSVGIFVQELPSQEIIEELKERVLNFSNFNKNRRSYNKDDIAITGIRILTENLTTIENTLIKF